MTDSAHRKQASAEALDVKANPGWFLDRVEAGESFVISRHGASFARLVPYAVGVDQSGIAEAIDGILALRRGQTLSGLSVRDLVRQGRA